MLNAFDGLDAYIANDGIYNQDNIPKSGFVRIDRRYLSHYLNLLAREQTITRQDLSSYKISLRVTKNLIQLIQEEYQLE